MRLAEYDVPCEWCGAKVGEPCMNRISSKVIETYQDYVHVVRKRTYQAYHEAGARA